jgi:hypothetical protein
MPLTASLLAHQDKIGAFCLRDVLHGPRESRHSHPAPTLGKKERAEGSGDVVA